MARVPPNEMEPVYAAQTELRRAQDDLNRQKVAVQDADGQRQVAEAGLRTADSKRQMEEKSLEQAKRTGNRAELDAAAARLEQAKREVQLADAKVQMVVKQRDVAKVNRDLAEARVETRQVQLEKARYATLRAHGDTRVEKIDPQSYEVAIADHEKDEAKLEQQLANEEKTLNEVRTKVQQLQASVANPNAG